MKNYDYMRAAVTCVDRGVYLCTYEREPILDEGGLEHYRCEWCGDGYMREPWEPPRPAKTRFRERVELAKAEGRL